MGIFGLAILALLGLVIGSYLNVLIYRLPKGDSPVKKVRSFCPHCKNKLKPQHLIPVFSFLWLKGKCRDCKKSISWQYPLVEIATAVLFVIIGIGFDIDIIAPFWVLARNLVFTAALVTIFVIDLRYLLILDVVILPLLPVAFFVNWGLSGWDFRAGAFLLLAGAIGYLFYWLQFFLSRGNWVGGGDMKLGALLGLLLGIKGLLATFFIAYVGGAIIAVSLVLLKRKNFKSQLPMGAFLAPAAWVVLMYGDQIISWYLQALLN